jgi:hypothetical protein
MYLFVPGLKRFSSSWSLERSPVTLLRQNTDSSDRHQNSSTAALRLLSQTSSCLCRRGGVCQGAHFDSGDMAV